MDLWRKLIAIDTASQAACNNKAGEQKTDRLRDLGKSEEPLNILANICWIANDANQARERGEINKKWKEKKGKKKKNGGRIPTNERYTQERRSRGSLFTLIKRDSSGSMHSL